MSNYLYFFIIDMSSARSLNANLGDQITSIQATQLLLTIQGLTSAATSSERFQSLITRAAVLRLHVLA